MRLWELPTFAERGELSAVHDARALTAGSAAGLLVSGDKHGAVKVRQPTEQQLRWPRTRWASRAFALSDLVADKLGLLLVACEQSLHS